MDTLISADTLAVCEPHRYRVVETGMTREMFDIGHIPGTVFWPCGELMTPKNRLRDDPAHFQERLSRAGITPETWVVCSFNGSPMAAGWAAWLFWIVTGFGHVKTFILDGGTPLWQAQGRPLTSQETAPTKTPYPPLSHFRESHRARLRQVQDLVSASGKDPSAVCLLDARSEKEFGGRHYFDGPPLPGQLTGHIPSARHLPHTAFFQADGTYRPAEELNALLAEAGADKHREIITYCAVGIRAAVPWFVLKHLLGFPEVRNYDGSWKEWSRAEEAVL